MNSEKFMRQFYRRHLTAVPSRGYQNGKLPRKHQQHLMAIVLVAIILLQQTQLILAHHISATTKTTSNGIANENNAKRKNDVDDAHLEKRTMQSAAGQPEEIFGVSDAAESNYDEYPMVVPKRAALLLDRLMLAFHRALEKQRSMPHGDHELLFDNRNSFVNSGIGNSKAVPIDDPKEGIPTYSMYSDDDPTVIMDYDFKDLNSINRATGETLMEKSFQRRPKNLGYNYHDEVSGSESAGGGSKVAMLLSPVAMVSDSLMGRMSFGGSTASSLNGRNGNGRGNGGSTARTYWRCYFNAVSCF